MEEKLIKTKWNACIFSEWYTETDEERFRNRAERMYKCLDLMLWDQYPNNRLMDLKKVNRCKDRFCPNCRTIANAIAVGKFKPQFKKLVSDGYKPYLITLTVPNVPGEELKHTIDRMQKYFRKFNQWLSVNDKNAFKHRHFDIVACVKALEITVEKKRFNYYHPHFHILAFLSNADDTFFNKEIADVKNADGSTMYLSKADIFISKLWTMAVKNISLKKYFDLPDFIEYENKERNYYFTDVRPIKDEGGIFEVFKYAFKDTDIETDLAFKTVFNAIDCRRLRQGHGLLYNFKLECEDEETAIDDADMIETYLELDKKETPQKVTTKSLGELTTTYKKFKKISRFKSDVYIEKVDD